jgi:hypothetical protein
MVPDNKNDCAGEGQQLFTGRDYTGKPNSTFQTEVDVGG